jgi:hypothetical protein
MLGAPFPELVVQSPAFRTRWKPESAARIGGVEVGRTESPLSIPVAKSSDRIGREIDGWRETPERRSDDFASLAVKGRSRHPTWNESDKTLGNS